jgi:hypothetical protein
MEDKKVGLKETLEIVKAVKLLAVTGVEIGKDGLGVEDIAKALELVKKLDVVFEAVKGLHLVDDELKDLEQDELLQLGAAAYDLVKDVILAVKK